MPSVVSAQARFVSVPEEIIEMDVCLHRGKDTNAVSRVQFGEWNERESIWPLASGRSFLGNDGVS